MKRHLDPHRHQLTDPERESIWHEVRRQTGLVAATPEGPRRGTSFRPAFALVAAAAVLTVLGTWWLGAGRLDENELVVAQNELALERSRESVAAPPPMSEVDIAVDRDSDAATGSIAESAPKSKDPAAAELSAEAADVAVAKAAKPEARTQGAVLNGRLRDAETGEPLAFATVLVRGTNLSAVADSAGVFHITGLQPDTEVVLQILMLGYEKTEQIVRVPDTEPLQVAYDLKPAVVETLQAFDVAGAEYMVEVKSAVTEHDISSGTFEKHGTGSTEEALNKKAGVVMRAGELYVRGGRSGEVSMRTDGVPNEPVPQSVQDQSLMGAALQLDAKSNGSVTGGTKPPNGEEVELMYFDHTGVNPFVATEDDSLSTFALDVDNASWTMTRNYLERGLLPPKDAVRVEEFVNAFDPGWPSHTDEAFRIHADGGASRFGQGYHLLRVGLVGKTIDDGERKPANLVFVIDISGSMSGGNRLGAVKKALHVLLDELREGDSVGIVTYGSQGRVLLEPTDISHREKIAGTIDMLITGGSTNVYEGLKMAYEMARRNLDSGKVNRLVLCSDGVANNGMSTHAETILDLVRKASDESITISAIGFGMGNYNDILMEKLADAGDGNYYYVDRHEEAERVFRENLTGLLQTIAREVKVQVAFDPDVVDRWRLLGYENRDVADRDFRNDAVDAGEIGVGHQVTALYELKLKASPDGEESGVEPSGKASAGTVRLRHEAPAHDAERAGQVEEIDAPLTLDLFAGDYADASAWRRVQMVAAEFAEILRGSYWAKESDLADLVPLADALVKDLPGDSQVADLAKMIRTAADLWTEKDGE